MNTNLTQRQASLVMMTASIAILCLMLIYALVMPAFPIATEVIIISVIGMSGITGVYWRGWDQARSVFLGIAPLFIGFILPPQMFTEHVVQAILIPPIIALVMGGARSIVISAVVVWLILALRAGWHGPLIQQGLLVNLLCVTGLVVGRIIMDVARENAEKNAAIARKQFEDLRLSEERYRAISQIISDYAFAYAVDEAGNIQREWTTGASFNSITGYERDELIRKGTYALYQQEDQERVHAEIQRVVLGDAVSGEYQIITKGGEKRWLLVRRFPIWNDDKTRVVRFYGAAQDITERKHAAEKLQQLNAELEQRVEQRTMQLEAVNAELEAFTYSVSHDLRAPLRAIDGFSRTIAQQYSDDLPEKALHYFTRIQSNIQRMNALIEDLLQLSRSSRKEMQREMVNMNQLVEQVLSDFRSRGEAGKATFTVGMLPACFADASLLQQVLVNLIENAIKYSSKVASPIIDIGYIIKDNETAYYVKDNGAGFDMQYAHKLFMIFQRLHSESEFDGTGVGLATVKRIITRHNGRVWAESKVDAGAWFYFTIGDDDSVGIDAND